MGYPSKILGFSALVLCACRGGGGAPSADTTVKQAHGKAMSCESNLPARPAIAAVLKLAADSARGGRPAHAGMVFIPAGTYSMGAADQEGRPDEYPAHPVKLDAFWMDASEGTNAQFR